MKAILNKDNRIKRDENSEQLQAIEQEIAQRIRAEYKSELLALRTENTDLFSLEKIFRTEAQEILSKLTTHSVVIVKTQTGKGSTRINEYKGSIQKEVTKYETWFNFISKDRDNDERPFTIGLSCLLSIDVISF